ncbi:MAG: hypothetical protein AB1306_07985 [Nitrospirota bacterium]
MKTNYLLNYIKEENKIFHLLDRLFLIIFPFISVLILYIVKEYIFHTEITKGYIVYSTVLIILLLIHLKSMILGRDVKDVESLIIKEVSPLLLKEDKKFTTWQKHKARLKIETIPPIILLVIAIIIINSPRKFSQYYFREAYVLLIIAYMFTFGFVRLRSFKNYMNELIRMYHSLTPSKIKDADETSLMRYDLRSYITWSFVVGSIFFIISRYLLLANAKLLHSFLLALSVSVLFVLGKGLYDAHKGFYKSLSQIDKLRSEAGLIEGSESPAKLKTRL